MVHRGDKLMDPSRSYKDLNQIHSDDLCSQRSVLQDDEFILRRFIHSQVAALPAVSVTTKLPQSYSFSIMVWTQPKNLKDACVDLFKPEV